MALWESIWGNGRLDHTHWWQICCMLPMWFLWDVLLLNWYKAYKLLRTYRSSLDLACRRKKRCSTWALSVIHCNLICCIIYFHCCAIWILKLLYWLLRQGTWEECISLKKVQKIQPWGLCGYRSFTNLSRLPHKLLDRSRLIYLQICGFQVS